MKTLDTNKLPALADALVQAGYRVIAPLSDGQVVRLGPWDASKDICLDRVPVNSVKDALMPPSEIIGRAEIEGNDFTLADVKPDAPKTVVLGARPCDVAALAALDAVFNWDYTDAFYNARRDATTLAALACTTADEQCFCTSVGGAPDAAGTADAMIRLAEAGKALTVEPLTDKGRALLDAAGTTLDDRDVTPDAPADVPVKFDAAKVTAWCAENFDADLWQTLSLACLGCGACAYACPTCHCFDMQDESTRTTAVRLRNWDSCGFGLFTLHASGHNPRGEQTHRWRQRVMHKFSYFPERFETLACTGCGRCARLCGAKMAISDVCQTIEKQTEAPA